MPSLHRLTLLPVVLLLGIAAPASLRAQTTAGDAATKSDAPSSSTANSTDGAAAPKPAGGTGSPVERSWALLEANTTAKSPETRAASVRALGMLTSNQRATALALKALADEDYDVRVAATDALGEQKALSAKERLHETIKTDKEPAVILGAARALLAMNDEFGYNVFYAVLTGEQKSGASLMDEQKKMLHDPKKLAQMGFEQGINFVPFGGIGLMVVKTLTKDDSSPVRAAAAKVLAADADVKSLGALEAATHDKSWIVQVAAIAAIAQRNDQTTVSTLELALNDPNAVVQSTAAAAVLHLNDVKQSTPAQNSTSVTRKRRAAAKH